MHSSGGDDEQADTKIYRDDILSDTDRIRRSRDYIYGIWQYKST